MVRSVLYRWICSFTESQKSLSRLKTKRLHLRQILDSLHLNMELPVENGPLLRFLMLHGQEMLSSQSALLLQLLLGMMTLVSFDKI